MAVAGSTHEVMESFAGQLMYSYVEVLHIQVRVLEPLMRGNRVDVRGRVMYAIEFLR